MDYRVTDFGALGDGRTDDTAAVQKALDACAAAGGGRVVLDGGYVYRTGYLKIGSYTDFHLESGAVLKASDELDRFSPDGSHIEPHKSDVPSYVNCEFDGGAPAYFLFAEDAEFITISGDGIIDGNEEIFYGTETKWHIDGAFYPRVPLIYFLGVRHLSIRNVTLQQSAFWTVHLVGCEDVLIDGIRILNDLRMANCDGIDPDHCRNVRISNCHIESADDCIVFKNTLKHMNYGPCENIAVTNCNLMSTSAAIKFGTESEDLFRNITINNINIRGTNRAIDLQLRDKGSIENVTLSNLNVETRLFAPKFYWGKAEAVYITAIPRNARTRVGHIRNVTIENLNASGENGIVIVGTDNNISGVRLKNVSVRLESKTDWEKGVLDLRPCEGEGLSNPGLQFLYVRDAEDVRLEDVRYSADETMLGLLSDEEKNRIE